MTRNQNNCVIVVTECATPSCYHPQNNLPLFFSFSILEFLIKLVANIMLCISVLSVRMVWNFNVDLRWQSMCATCIMYNGIILFVFVHFFEVLKHQAWNCQIANAFVKCPIYFHIFFSSASMDDDSFMCEKRMCVNRFIAITEALD